MRRVLVLLAVAGCGEPYSNDDLRFVRSVPARDQLQIDLPRGAMTTQTGSIAKYYLQLVEISQGVNDAIFEPLGTINAIAAQPPSFRDTDVRAWGPIPTSSSVRISLFMVRTSTPGVRVPTATTTIVPVRERFDFAMHGQLGPNGEQFLVMGGSFAPVGDDGQGIGGITVDLDAYARLDPNAPGRGSYAGAYDDREGQAIVFIYQAPSGVAAYYRLSKSDSGVDFFVLQRSELYSPSGGASPLETSSLVAHWLPDNRGRADVRYEGGDLPAPLTARECWDVRFRRVYFAASSPDLGMGEGSAAACP